MQEAGRSEALGREGIPPFHRESIFADVQRQQLFAYIDDLSKKLSETESELQDKKDAMQKVRSDLKEQMEEVRTLIREKVS